MPRNLSYRKCHQIDKKYCSTNQQIIKTHPQTQKQNKTKPISNQTLTATPNSTNFIKYSSSWESSSHSTNDKIFLSVTEPDGLLLHLEQPATSP
jgi:hypothetical protein